jgi:hypothetical protein
VAAVAPELGSAAEAAEAAAVGGVAAAGAAAVGAFTRGVCPFVDRHPSS